MKNKDLYKEVKATLILIVVLAGISMLTYIISIPSAKKIIFLSVALSMLLAILFTTLNKYIKNDFFNRLTTIICFPLGIIYALLTVIIPFWTIPVHLLMYFAIATLIPILTFNLLSQLYIITSSNLPAALYILITSIVFVSVLFNAIIRDLLYRISPVRIRTSKKLKVYQLDQLTDYFLSIDVVRFWVYGTYVVTLVVINFHNLQGKLLNDSLDIDKAVLQSFVTFIAFDRAFVLLKQLQFRPSELLEKIRQSVFRKVREESNDLIEPEKDIS